MSKDSMDKAYTIASHLLRDTLEAKAPELLKELDRVEQDLFPEAGSAAARIRLSSSTARACFRSAPIAG
jgi:hypothetical protein